VVGVPRVQKVEALVARIAVGEATFSDVALGAVQDDGAGGVVDGAGDSAGVARSRGCRGSGESC
jgi:hypothetical protein